MQATLKIESRSSNQDIEALKAKERELKAVERSLKAAQRLADWEAEVAAVNPQYQIGSVRRATEEVSSLGHCHGQVCEIMCQECGERRIVNLQDARQCRFCKHCKATVNQVKAKAHRTTKRLSGRTVADLERDIEAARVQLEAMTAAKVA